MSGSDSGNVPAGTPQQLLRQRLSHPQDVTPGPSTTRPPNPSFRTLPLTFFFKPCLLYTFSAGGGNKKGLPYIIPTYTYAFSCLWWRSPGQYTAPRPLCVVMPELAFSWPIPRGAFT